GDLLTIGLGQHPALGHSAPPRRSHFAEELQQDQLLRPVGIKPIYSRFVTPLAGTAAKLGELQVPVTCGGVAVNPADMILADDDGVIVVDPDRIRGLLESASAIKEAEGKLVERLEAGDTVSDGLNLQEHVAALTRGEPSSLRFLA
ncbi:MAG: hypothetical protein ACRDQU_00105, partial [Pseudonocardiaceae bacterium]